MEQTVYLFESKDMDKESRLRFVKGPEGDLWFDIDEKAPAENEVYIPCERALLVKAIDEKLFESAFAVTVHEDLLQVVTDFLKKKLVASLSMAKKSGLSVLGLEKVKEVYHKGSIATVFLASDAGGDVTKRVYSWDVGTCNELSKDDLSQALGGENISLVGLLDKPQIENVKVAWERYHTFFINE
ncbi:MAG: putative RNA-binding protein YlxR (DUF448 family) [Alphaproteobacteria bacterium]|jgi:predicted RNA-binding protein YlxR (DUF448 family)